MTDTQEGGNVRWRVRIYFSGVCSERYDGYGSAALQENAFMPRSQMWQPGYDAMRNRFILLALFSLLALSPVAPLRALSATATSPGSFPAIAPGDTRDDRIKA